VVLVAVADTNYRFVYVDIVVMEKIVILPFLNDLLYGNHHQHHHHHHLAVQPFVGFRLLSQERKEIAVDRKICP
jgi:hypothetical protein